jgi:hypothetical protein
MQPNRGFEANAVVAPHLAESEFAPAPCDRRIKANVAEYQLDHDPVFRGVLPHDLDEPSRTPSHWPGAVLPGE